MHQSNYNFLPTNNDPNVLLVAAGRRLQVLSLQTGKPHPILQQKAEEHARYQAEHEEQGHQNWDSRYPELYKLIPECESFSEVCAESWPENTEPEAADEMYHSWQQSPSHWGAVNGGCAYYGYAMAKGANGVWYACGQFGYLRPTSSSVTSDAASA